MSCIVIFRECMKFSRLTFNVSLLPFCWNISNDHRNSTYICLTSSIWKSEQNNWSSMSRTMLCKASKPVKSVALLNATNVSIGSCNKCFIAICSPDCPRLSGWHLHTLAPAYACLAHSARSTLQWCSHRWASVKHVASGFIRSPLQFIKSEGLESNMSKVRTYQLNAHQRHWFKMRT